MANRVADEADDVGFAGDRVGQGSFLSELFGRWMIGHHTPGQMNSTRMPPGS